MQFELRNLQACVQTRLLVVTISNVHLRDAEFSKLNFSRRSLDRKMLANLLTKNSTQSVSASTRAFRTAA